MPPPPRMSFNEEKEHVKSKGQRFEFDAEKNMYKNGLSERSCWAVRVLEYLKTFG